MEMNLTQLCDLDPMIDDPKILARCIIPTVTDFEPSDEDNEDSNLDIPDFEPSDEYNEDVHGYMSANAFPDINEFEPCDEYIEDNHGYENRIQGISKDYHDHGDPTEQCVKCGALLWLAESRVGSTNSTREG
ncbi:hypothetical protein Tco_1416772, partial [Tanacetum coccineum]